MSRYFQKDVRPGSAMTAEQFNNTPRRVYDNAAGSGVKTRYGGKALIQGGGKAATVTGGGFVYLGVYDYFPAIPLSNAACFYHETDGQLWCAQVDQTKWYPMQKYTTLIGTPT